MRASSVLAAASQSPKACLAVRFPGTVGEVLRRYPPLSYLTCESGSSSLLVDRVVLARGARCTVSSWRRSCCPGGACKREREAETSKEMTWLTGRPTIFMRGKDATTQTSRATCTRFMFVVFVMHATLVSAVNRTSFSSTVGCRSRTSSTTSPSSKSNMDLLRPLTLANASLAASHHETNNAHCLIGWRLVGHLVSFSQCPAFVLLSGTALLTMTGK